MQLGPFYASWIAKEDAVEMVRGCTEKPGGVDPGIHLGVTSGALLAGDFPLELFAANECGDRYDHPRHASP